MTTTTTARRTSGWRAAAVVLLATALAAVGMAPAMTPSSDGPMRILVFAEAYGFSHTASIVAGTEWFLDLEATDPDRFDVTVALDGTEVAGVPVEGLEDDGIEAWEWLRADSLQDFDLLVWNNATGEVPFPEDERDELRQGVVDFVSEHGIVGLHAAADSNYTWPAFHELIGGQYDGHWYRFGGFTPEPYRLELNVEDPGTPLLDGVDPAFDSYDETYRWQMDVRPDVHVIHSMNNASIYAQGALYHYQQPITWCRPVGAEGRSWYTNLGHDGVLWSDADYKRMILNAVLWAGGAMEADVDCSVPVDPATGVAGSERLNALYADTEGARLEVSTYSGGLTAVTDIEPGVTTITFRDVELDGATAVDLFAAPHTMAAPSTTGLTGGPTPARITQAAGGDVQVRLDSADGEVVGTATLLPAPAPLPHTNVPAPLQDVQATAGPAGSWSVLRAELGEVSGTHDLVLTFPASEQHGALQAVDPAAGLFGSLAWIHVDR